MKHDNITAACDMPLLNHNLLKRMVELAQIYDAVVPRVQGKIDPLHAIYSKNCIPAIHHQIERDNLRISDFLENVHVRYMQEDEIDVFDPHHLSLFNINTPADLQKAQQHLSQENNAWSQEQ